MIFSLGGLMNSRFSWFPAALVLAGIFATTGTQAVAQSSPSVLHNRDVLRMVKEGLGPDEIVSTILNSNCAFDIFPPVMKDLRSRGVPDSVLHAMRIVPYGPPSIVAAPAVTKPKVLPLKRLVQIPAGTLIGVEVAKTVSSADIENGNQITFVVSKRISVNKAVVVDRGALVTARVIKSKPAGFWGRAGAIEFEMEDVVAVDGTRIPIGFSHSVKGNNHTTALAAAAIATGALVFPYASPVGLIWALKKGDDAVLDQGTQLIAVVKSDQAIAGLLPEKKAPTYHSVEDLKQNLQKAQGLPAFNNSFRPTPIKQ